MRQHISLRKLPRRSKAPAQFIKKSEIDINFLILRAVKRSRRRSCVAATRERGIAKQHQLSVMILRPSLRRQKRRPGGLHIIQHKGNKLNGRLLRSILRRIRLARLRLRRASASAKQSKKIHFEHEAKDQQNNRAANPNMKSAKLKSTATAALIAAIFDIGAFPTWSPSHKGTLLRVSKT